MAFCCWSRKNDRKMRIEVGYGLEGTLTDLHSKLIIENTMVPAFRAGDFAGGIIRGRRRHRSWCWKAMRPSWKRAASAIRPGAVQRPIDPVLVIFIVIWVAIFFGGFAHGDPAADLRPKIGPSRYRWLGMDFDMTPRRSRRDGSGGSSGEAGPPAAAAGRLGQAAAAFPVAAAQSGGGGASGSW